MIIRKGIINNFCGAVIAASFLGIMYGNTISWSSPVEYKLKNVSDENPFDRPLKPAEISWISSLVTLGACVGCWAFALFEDLFGRRLSLIIMEIPMVVGFLLMIIIKEVYIFYGARFAMGITVGGFMTVNSTYLSEIAPKEIRGRVCAWVGVMVSTGVLLCYIIGPFVSVTNFNIILLAFPTISLVLAFIFSEESPYYLIMKQKSDLAKTALSTFRKADANIDDEFKEIEAKIKEQYEENLLGVIKTKAFIKSIIMGNVLLIFQQLTGVNVILMYSEMIFHKTGSHLQPWISAIIIGSIFLVSGSLAPLIVEKFNRITLLTASASGMIFFESILGIYCIVDDAGYDIGIFKFLPTLSLGLFIFSYNFGNGPVSWIVPAEIYPTRAKAFCLSFSIFMYFLIGFILAQYFHFVVEAIGLGFVCLIFAACCIGSIFFYLLFLVETRGKTLGEIQDELKR